MTYYRLNLLSIIIITILINSISISQCSQTHLSSNRTTNIILTTSTASHTTTTLNQMAIHEELMGNTWDYMTEVIFILILAIFTIPANIFLLLFYIQKVRRYKQLKHLNARYVRIANSFHTYLIEICSFDTIIVVYLILNTFFQFLFYLKKSEYESVFDVSNFACKFFIYILRISGAMSNYLVFLLSLNRCFLILFRYKPMQLSSHRLCLNTKYLTLFLFCICTIANVFRLEALNLNSTNTTPLNSSLIHILMQFKAKTKLNDFWFNNENSTSKTNELLTNLNLNIPAGSGHFSEQVNSECAPSSVSYSISDSTNTLYWSIFIYNLIFAIIPALGNLILSIYLIKKRAEFKVKLILFTEFLLNAKLNIKTTSNNNNNTSNGATLNNITNLEEIVSLDKETNCTQASNEILSPLNLIELPKKLNFQLNEFHAEFLKTCTPCIAFSLTHVILFLPYSIIELINQMSPNLTIMTLLQYMTYVRYLFYCCKFYLLFFVSYRFRREFSKFFKNNKSQKQSLKKLLNRSKNLGFNVRSYNIEMKQSNANCA